MKKAYILIALAIAGSSAAIAAPMPTVDVYKSPSCGCCGKWVDHMKQAGFKVQIHEMQDPSTMRAKAGIPDSYGSCHTAMVGGYTVEGHVPPADVQRLLRERPAAIGLSAPGMPASAPGMDMPGKTAFQTLLITKNGSSKIFAQH